MSYHEKWLREEDRTTGFELLELDGCQDIFKNKNLLNEWIEEINSFIV